MTFSGAAHLAGDAALVAGRAAWIAGRLLQTAGVQALREEGASGGEIDEIQATADALLAAGRAWASRTGHADVRMGDSDPDMAARSAGHVAEREWSVVEAAEVLGMTPRHLRRLAAAGAGYQVGGRWVLPAETVARLVLERRVAS